MPEDTDRVPDPADASESVAEIVSRYDRGTLSKARVDEQTGFLRAPASVTRTGVFIYVDASGKRRRELRHPDDVFAAESLATLRSAVVTHHHPAAGAVTAFNARGLQVGHTDSTEPEIEGGRIRTGLTITDADAIRDVIDGITAEVSAGYRTRVVAESGEYRGERYDARQTQIRYNHVALVPKGRAGSTVRVHLDSADAVLEGEPEQLSLAVTPPAPAYSAPINGDTMQITIGEGPASVSLDGTTYGGVHEGLASAIVALQKSADTATARADQAEADLAAKPEAKIDTAEVHRLAIERAGLLARVAGVVKLDEAEAEALAGMTAAEIRAFVVGKATDVKVDEKSPDYIEARFDVLPALAEESAPATPKPGPALLAASHSRADSSADSDIEAQIHRLQGLTA